MFDLLATGRLGGPEDLRNILTFEKIKGDLTNVFYSMESSNTTFYTHQFRPVLKFIESPVGRLLLADEVGLGKTIESIYIWKELQAREYARRLLVVCPAMLREKWRDDLQKRFNISSEILNSKDLYRRTRGFVSRGINHTFVYIISLEGLRPPTNFLDDENTTYQASFARLLDQNSAQNRTQEEFVLFDLVIIDEAHYLRNPLTANNRLGRLLREASRHYLLLTATPIQIKSENLFQLLRLIDPDQFYDAQVFQSMLRANAPIIRALRELWRSSDTLEPLVAIEEALDNEYFEGDAVLQRIKDQLSEKSELNHIEQVELCRLLESRSLLSQVMTRSRKSEVLERAVVRSAQTLNVDFEEPEKRIYNHVTERIQAKIPHTSGVSLFALIARQRQMASSLVAALEGWEEKGLIEELVWEDLGRSVALAGNGRDIPTDGYSWLDSVIDGISIEDPINSGIKEIDYQELERIDTKYNKLRTFLKGKLEEIPTEKFVVFAFFRGTLKYLARRLKDDGIYCALIMGGMGDVKNKIIKEFSRPSGPSVLLSSEVGSEGIDLQFCRIIVNYDLPWNPMKVEQRIGRIDRLGQKAEKITIVNFAVRDTIEDKILLRLYDRIQLFKASIGDLEEILGPITEQLMIELLSPSLTDDERKRKADDAAKAILNSRKDQDRLEKEAVNLIGFTDFILDSINKSREKGRWLSAEEMLQFVGDFLGTQYPGTKFERDTKLPLNALIRLASKARDHLDIFISQVRPGTPTRLHHSTRPVICVFDPRRSDELPRGVEIIEPTHPLIQWIRQYYIELGMIFHPAVAIKVGASDVEYPRGLYVFVTLRWSFVGLRTENLLIHQAMSIDDNRVLDTLESESLIRLASRNGEIFPNAFNRVEDINSILESVRQCDKALDNQFSDRVKDFEAENEIRCNQQETSAKAFANRKIEELKNRIARYKEEGKKKPIPMTEGLLRTVEERLRRQLERINQRRIVDPTMKQLATGLILIK